MIIQLGIDSPRLASNGSDLLDPRIISLIAVETTSIDEGNDVTLSVMSFGQFITHDITFSEDFTFGRNLIYNDTYMALDNL